MLAKVEAAHIFLWITAYALEERAPALANKPSEIIRRTSAHTREGLG
jgi:hypothetical protein